MMPGKKELCMSSIRVFLKVTQTSKMTFGLEAPSLPSQMKMLEVFFDYENVIHCEFIPEGKIVNKELLTGDS